MEKALFEGYGEIEDLLDGELPFSFFRLPTCHMSRLPASYFFLSSCTVYFPGYVITASQAIEAHREEQRRTGAEIAPNARRSLDEQLLAIQARLQSAHRMLRRLQRVRAQVISALWPGVQAPRTPSRSAERLAVAEGRFKA